ncbi:hypothetical protein MP228_004987 [Amoeboaphelidium protococcarum]|nr:hypothetical protein MP228_006821 [Amoeboaphelidium protococcarum]KAI3649518.1 hypothetical protein MP228_005150 [Amoeboaphelidium protococcarum]KAI3650160.1 hypothetical protein MP228_004987 [Amoeboaphelidium protococcarum]
MSSKFIGQLDQNAQVELLREVQEQGIPAPDINSLMECIRIDQESEDIMIRMDENMNDDFPVDFADNGDDDNDIDAAALSDVSDGSLDEERQEFIDNDPLSQQAQRVMQNATSVSHLKSCRRYWSRYVVFHKERNPDFDKFELNALTPLRIVQYLFYLCGDQGTVSTEYGGMLLECQGRSYSTAENVRAALSHAFSKRYNCLQEPYRRNADGSWTGNPCLSRDVSNLMKGLKKIAVRKGVIPESVRSITQTDLRNLFERSHSVLRTTGDRVRFSRNYLIYVLSFLCLLRLDEAVRIQMQDIEWMPRQKDGFVLRLWWRKTMQTGGSNIKPFHLYRNDKYPWLCPVRALYNWVYTLRKVGGMPDGYQEKIMCKITSQGTIILNTAVETQQFRDSFRQDLKMIIGQRADVYGNHSFRRGGCQYLNGELMPARERWGIKKLCDWGCWSVECTALTVVRYLVSDSDLPVCARHKYMRVVRKDEVHDCNCVYVHRED